MKRLALAVVMTLVVSANAQVPGSRTAVDLNAPGKIESLQRDNPVHFDKISRILSEVQNQPVETVPKWMAAEFDARTVRYTDLIMTSNPPQKRLEFTLDATAYTAVVRIGNVQPRLVPAK